MTDLKLVKAVAKGLITYIPGASFILDRKKRVTRHSGAQAEFCYNLWLKILVNFKENLQNPSLREIGEIGTGGSLGVGICALLTGCQKYYALELNEVFNKDQNLNLLDELLILFQNKTKINSNSNQSNIKINNHDFPDDIIQPQHLIENIKAEIRNDILNNFRNSKRIIIVKKWETQPSLELDLIFSRATMEHVTEPESVYTGIKNHLKKGSYMLHDIDFHSHGITKEIFGHYIISDYLWKIIFGRRLYFLNRWQLKDHVRTISNKGFEIIETQVSYIDPSKSDEKLPSGAMILAKSRYE